MKRILLLILILAFFLPSTIYSENKINVQLDGKLLEFDVTPQILNGRTLVPLRAIFEALGATVDWDANTQTVVGTKDTNVIKLQIDRQTANVNGKDVTLDVPAKIINGRTMVPIRFISESMNASVVWDGGTSTVVITSSNGKPTEDSNILTVGMDDTYPPMEYKDETGTNIVGFDVDLAKELGKRLGKDDVRFVSTDWNDIFVGLNEKKYDCIISGLTSTEERKAKFAFTKPYLNNKQVIVTSASDTEINSLMSLANKKVCTQSGTNSDELIQDLIKNKVNIDYSTFDYITQALEEVRYGRSQAAVADKVVAKFFVINLPDQLKIVWESNSDEPYAIALRKEDSTLRDKMDAVLSDMFEDGTMKVISEKWFGEDITKGAR